MTVDFGVAVAVASDNLGRKLLLHCCCCAASRQAPLTKAGHV